MKTVILFGSPRKDGNTKLLTDAFVGALPPHTNVKLLHLNDMTIRPCQGCLACAEKGTCMIKDDMGEVVEQIMGADLVVYASPVYWFSPSAQLKIVIDRGVVFFDKDYNSRVKGKKAVTLMTYADTDSDVCEPALGIFTRTFESLGLEYAGHIEVGGCEAKGMVAEGALEAARTLAASLS